MSKSSLVPAAAFSALALAFMVAGCGTDESFAPAGGDGATAVESAALSEVLAVDVSESFDRGLFGKKYDFSYPVGGGTVLRHDLKVTTTGSADATMVSLDGNEAKVHAWADMYSGFHFELKVWVER